MSAPNLNAFIGILAKQVQDFEDALYAVLVSRHLTHATGAQLDFIGEIVGKPRTSLIDSEYRQAIQLQIFINNLSGNPVELAYVARQLSGADAVRYIEISGGNYRLQLVGAEVPADLLTAMQRLSVGGVRLLGIHTTYPLRRFHMGDHVGQGLLIEEEA